MLMENPVSIFYFGFPDNLHERVSGTMASYQKKNFKIFVH